MMELSRAMRLAALITLPIVYFAGFATVVKGQCKCGVPISVQRAYDSLLYLNKKQEQAVKANVLPYGAPKKSKGASNEQLLLQRYSAIMYDRDLRVPLWATYPLTAEDAAITGKRTDCFRPDPRFGKKKKRRSKKSPNITDICSEYSGSEYSRGRLIALEDMYRDESAVVNTSVFTNVVPQKSGFRKGIWAYLGCMTREWAQEKGDVYITVGCIFDADGDGKRDRDAKTTKIKESSPVAAPTAFFKIVLHRSEDGAYQALAFILPHDSYPDMDAVRSAKNAYLLSHMVSINDIEQLTGVDFFAELPDEVEQELEGGKAESLWSESPRCF